MPREPDNRKNARRGMLFPQSSSSSSSSFVVGCFLAGISEISRGCFAIPLPSIAANSLEPRSSTDDENDDDDDDDSWAQITE
jgi:hypothetical protein